MYFHIPVTLHPTTSKLELNHTVLSVGSCFADHISAKLKDYKINSVLHPFGTLYHPEAIAKALNPSIEINEDLDLIIKDGVIFHWDTHSKIWGQDIESITDQYNVAVKKISNAIRKSDWIIVTLGTSFKYVLKHSGRTVANCHKEPHNNFEKKLSTSDEILSTLEKMQEFLITKNPEIQILYTVSPVRHIRDGLTENHISKGILLATVKELTKTPNVHYFPAYEIVMDQLRDYRYFEKDGIHPNPIAIDFIWEQLQKTWMDEKLQTFVREWHPILSAMNHKSLYPGTKSHKMFITSMIEKLKNFKYHVDVKTEIKHFESQL